MAMKKIGFILLTMILLISISFAACENEKVIPASDLPKEITNWISTHFPDNPVMHVKVETKNGRKKYEVELEGGFSLEFNNKKEITEIEGYGKLPDSVIHAKILQYVKTHYPGNYITKWELERNKQEIELDNGLELEFDLKDNFIRIDN